MHINRSLRLAEGEFIAAPAPKTGIAIHHTVGGSVASTVAWWQGDKTPKGTPRRVGTAYLIERDGTIYEVFDPEQAWAFQFGLTWDTLKMLAFEQRFIGIELASEGGLTEHDGQLYAFDRVSPRTQVDRASAFDHGAPYRGYQWFDRYESAQIETLGALVDHLCDRFTIPRVYPDRPFDYYGEALALFEGVIGHAMVRQDKTDPAPDPMLWQALEAAAGLTPAPVLASPAKPASRPLAQRARAQLFQENAMRLNELDVQAGSIVKALLMELDRRNVFVQLHDPTSPNGHRIGYTMVRGNAQLVARLGRALGLQSTDNGLLEVRHA